LPPELAQFRHPKNKSAAEAAAFALIEFLKSAAKPARASTDNIRVGAWLEKFTSIEGNPRAARNIAKNRPYSVNTIIRYEGLYRLYAKDAPFSRSLMREVEEEDALEFVSRASGRRMKGGGAKKKLSGAETFEKIVKFLRMAFNEHQKSYPAWRDAFRNIDPPKNTTPVRRDALAEDEVVSLLAPGVLRDAMELAVRGSMFLAGLRRGKFSPSSRKIWTGGHQRSLSAGRGRISTRNPGSWVPQKERKSESPPLTW
jgi:hypothetical protein